MPSLRSALFLAAAVSPAAADPVPADTALSISTDCERALALSAVPQHLRDRASVLVLDTGRYRTARSGDGPLTCLVERNHPSSVIPVCYDREGTRAILPARVAASEAAMRGATPEELAAEFEEAAAQGRYQAPERPGLAWMVSAHNRILNDGAIQPVGPHLMFYAPGLGDADIGGSPDPRHAGHGWPFVIEQGIHGFAISFVSRASESTEVRSRCRGQLPDHYL